jgi:hypothetical protein
MKEITSDMLNKMIRAVTIQPENWGEELTDPHRKHRHNMDCYVLLGADWGNRFGGKNPLLLSYRSVLPLCLLLGVVAVQVCGALNNIRVHTIK